MSKEKRKDRSFSLIFIRCHQCNIRGFRNYHQKGKTEEPSSYTKIPYAAANKARRRKYDIFFWMAKEDMLFYWSQFIYFWLINLSQNTSYIHFQNNTKRLIYSFLKYTLCSNFVVTEFFLLVLIVIFSYKMERALKVILQIPFSFSWHFHLLNKCISPLGF